MTIGDKIRHYRNKMGLTQKKLGELSGTSERTIQQYEGGKRQPRLEQLKKIATALNTPIVDLFESENNEGTVCDLTVLDSLEQVDIVINDFLAKRKLRNIGNTNNEYKIHLRDDKSGENKEFKLYAEDFENGKNEEYKLCTENFENGVIVKAEDAETGLTYMYNLYTDPEQDKALSDRFEILINSFIRLNNLGQTEAIKRVEELTEIKKYTQLSHKKPKK